MRDGHESVAVELGLLVFEFKLMCQTITPLFQRGAIHPRTSLRCLLDQQSRLFPRTRTNVPAAPRAAPEAGAGTNSKRWRSW